MIESEIPRLLLDGMLSGTIAAQLRDRGRDVTAVVEDVSLVSTPDEDLLAYASEQRRVLVTANISDFAVSLATGEQPGAFTSGSSTL